MHGTLLLSSYWGHIPDMGAPWPYHFICVVLEVAKEKGWYSTANSLLHYNTRGAVRPDKAGDKEVRRMLALSRYDCTTLAVLCHSPL